MHLDKLLDTYELNNVYWAIKSNKTDLSSMENRIVDLIGRSDGKQSTISRLYDLLPKETNWNMKVTCNKECSDLKNRIQKQVFMKNLLSSLHEMRLGTFLRQATRIFQYFYYYIHRQSSNIFRKIEELTCLEFGNDNCNNGTVDLMGVMEKMKFAYYSATSKDLMKMQQKLLEANFTYKLSNIVIEEDEVFIIYKVCIDLEKKIISKFILSE